MIHFQRSWCGTDSQKRARGSQAVDSPAERSLRKKRGGEEEEKKIRMREKERNRCTQPGSSWKTKKLSKTTKTNVGEMRCLSKDYRFFICRTNVNYKY